METPRIARASQRRGAPFEHFIRAFRALICIAAFSARAEQLPDATAREPALELTRHEFVAPHMGTLFRLVFFAPDAAKAQVAARAAFARVAALNRILSDYDPTSELVRLAAPPAGTPVPVSVELFDVLEHSQQLADRSGGAFDVTLGPVVDLWREARRTRRLPTEGERAAARRAAGREKLRLNPALRTVTLLAPNMRLDLGGIAKGYAADEALAVLVAHGVRHAMVAASGDLALGAAPPGTDGWKVQLAPFAETGCRSLVLIAANVGISTSGDAEQFVEIDGVRYSHIVDPATALGLTTGLAVTAVARRATISDAWATACSVLAGGDRGRMADAVGEAALVLVHRRETGGTVQSDCYGRSPPGLRTRL